MTSTSSKKSILLSLGFVALLMACDNKESDNKNPFTFTLPGTPNTRYTYHSGPSGYSNTGTGPSNRSSNTRSFTIPSTRVPSTCQHTLTATTTATETRFCSELTVSATVNLTEAPQPEEIDSTMATVAESFCRASDGSLSTSRAGTVFNQTTRYDPQSRCDRTRSIGHCSCHVRPQALPDNAGMLQMDLVLVFKEPVTPDTATDICSGMRNCTFNHGIAP